jgi:hypothetical protein
MEQMELIWGNGRGGRLIVIALAPGVAHRVLAASRDDARRADQFVVDAVSRLLATVATGRAVEAAPGPMGGDIVEVWLPDWVVNQVDQLIGTDRQFTDRSTVIGAALVSHLSGVGMASSSPSASPTAPPAGSLAQREYARDPRRADRELRERSQQRPSSPSLTLDRSIARLGTLVNPTPDAAAVDLRALLADAGADAPPVNPRSIMIGSSVNVGGTQVVTPQGPKHDARASRMSGLTNRVAPTLWAASRLIELQLANAGEAVPFETFIASVMPEAWRIGEGLEKWEAGRAEGAFSVSARWPKTPRLRRSLERWTREEAELEAQRRVAQSAVSFIEYSLMTVSVNSRGLQGRSRGPLVALGLADAWLGPSGGIVAGVQPASVELLLELAHAGATCEYPHSEAAWTAYDRFLRSSAPTEHKGMVRLLRQMSAATSRTDFYERVADYEFESMKITRRKGGASKGPSTDANGFIGRMREWGLLELSPGLSGVEAVTPRGRALLND